MDNATAHEAAKMIVQTFPSEVVPTYFKPAIRKRDSATGKSQVSRGELIAKWRNRKSENKKLAGQMHNSALSANPSVLGIYLSFHIYMIFQIIHTCVK